LINWALIMKLKTNKTFIKRPTQKMKNQKNRDWSWNISNQEGQTVMFRGRERERRRGKKRKVKWQQTRLLSETLIAPTEIKHDNASNNTTKDYFWMLWGIAQSKGIGASHAPPSMAYMHILFCFFIYLAKCKSPHKLTF
jgi:hypothetical protein